MALHTELPIYRTGVRLLDLAVRAQVVKGDFTKTYRTTSS